MYITDDYIDHSKCVICGELVPYYELDENNKCEYCQENKEKIPLDK